MLTELKRYNSVADKNGILFLVSIIAGKKEVRFDEIRNRCFLEKNVVVNCQAAIAFFEYLGLVNMRLNVVMPSPEFNILAGQDEDKIINRLVIISIDKLIEDGIFDKNLVKYNVEKKRVSIKRSAFPLEYAAIRNFLIMAYVFDEEDNEEMYVAEKYETVWTEKLGRRRKIRIDQLLEQQEEHNRRGAEAEDFVLHLEQQRIPEMAEKIRKISNFDVAAGYDIISYKDSESENYDRFIEVKCFSGVPHFFWSENEVEVAKIKAENYILCLVDYERITMPGYTPEYISNPYRTILGSNDWLINTSSYRIQKAY